MKAPVILLFLSALLAAGTCLECEVCSGPGNTCNGVMTTCSSGEDSCFLALIERSETFGSVKYIQTMKGCVTSRVCGRSPAIFNSAVKQRIALTCCTGNSCKTASAQLSAENVVPNGLYCPYCIVLGSTYSCNATVSACTGEENQCLNVTGSHGSGPGNMATSFISCATPSACALVDAFGDGSQKVFEVFQLNISQHMCARALGLASSSPGHSRLLLPAFSGLILAMFLA
ncbi:phospholipase A2 inhibitor subunit gamma B-like [Alligator sinensis]|uniref:phospholipase A2 inhibitor subunit gamma B-like n=1 Tax=Alligator sinensis TaxID=38654 RepID=A0A1U7SF37_ALLSI|nr:phospholipase A2 inhibitor subunit gamma B-like [Alligator sinensis]XP_025072244.1 phospholipase A2 inhibitor subunit gamma B-like [Alligator sinensis]XP_025072245.1 phospholipase A2 inhibitor subunit gamma B-like [Alligator sinensis]